MNAAVTAVGYLVQFSPKNILLPGVETVTYIGLAIVVNSNEYALAPSLAAAGAATLLARVIRDVCLFGDAAYLRDSPPDTELLFALIGLILVAQRRRYLRRVTREAAAHRPARDAAWRALAEDPANAGPLAELRALCDDLAASCASRHARHFNRLGASGPANISYGLPLYHRAAGPEARGDFGPLPLPRWEARDERSPVASLDQLYAQAAFVAPQLHGLCRRWAAASRGTVEGREPARPADSLAGWVGRGVVKPPERAIEKALACHGGDVSLLTDVCRARILFEEAGDVAACVRAVAACGGEAEVVRVRNGMDPRRDARATMGFRVSARGLWSAGLPAVGGGGGGGGGVGGISRAEATLHQMHPSFRVC